MVNCVSVTASQMLFARLLELDPSLHSLFDTNLNSHRVKFMATLRNLLSVLDDPQQFQAMARHLGTVYMESGLQPQHYETMEQALLWMLQRTLGRSFTPDVQKAWQRTYALVVRQMQEAAQRSMP